MPTYSPPTIVLWVSLLILIIVLSLRKILFKQLNQEQMIYRKLSDESSNLQYQMIAMSIRIRI